MEWKLIKDGTPDDDREVLLAVQGTDIPIQAGEAMESAEEEG